MREEALHLLVVTRQDEDDLPAQVLYLWEEVVEDGTAAGVGTGRKLVRLVDEEDASPIVENLFNQLLTARDSDIGESRASRLLKAAARNDAD